MLFCFTFLGRIYADDNQTEKPASCDDTKYKTQEAKKACKTIDSYCFGGTDVDTSNLKGCFYDENDTVYTKASILDSNWVFGVNISNVSLTKDYKGLDENGNIVFAGCYKYTDSILNPIFNPPGGDIYLFKVVHYNDYMGDCVSDAVDIVPSQGLSKSGLFGIISRYDGRNAIGSDDFTFNWTAKTGGECPLAFSTTVNAKWYTSSKHKYIFADSDIEVAQGDTKKAVVVTSSITVVNAMGKLYMTVTVQ